jgi:two-component system secretion response regulator SsrB
MGTAFRMSRLLLVDDDEQFLAALTLLLEDAELEVVAWARNGAEAVGIAAAFEPDLVVMDVDMPVLDGLEATRLIRDRQPDVLVLLISGSDFAERAREFLDAVEVGAVGYVPKRRVRDELVEAIDRALRLVRV